MSILYDFLFIDQERVRSLYAQLFDGLHEAMDKMVAKTATKGTRGQLGGDPFAHVAHERSENVAQSRSDRFSPHDLLLQDVIGGLMERNLIAQDPASASTGNLVLLSGSLTMLDVGVVDVALNLLPAIADIEMEETLRELPKTQRKTGRKQHEQSIKSGMTLINAFSQIMPKIVQFVLKDPQITAWGAVQQENMRAQIGSIMIQQGPQLEGEWHVLGIVDSGKTPPSTASDVLPDIYAGIRETLGVVQNLFARPEGDICITPILIFRKISGPDQTTS